MDNDDSSGGSISVDSSDGDASLEEDLAVMEAAFAFGAGILAMDSNLNGSIPCSHDNDDNDDNDNSPLQIAAAKHHQHHQHHKHHHPNDAAARRIRRGGAALLAHQSAGAGIVGTTAANATNKNNNKKNNNNNNNNNNNKLLEEKFHFNVHLPLVKFTQRNKSMDQSAGRREGNTNTNTNSPAFNNRKNQQRGLKNAGVSMRNFMEKRGQSVRNLMRLDSSSSSTSSKKSFHHIDDDTSSSEAAASVHDAKDDAISFGSDGTSVANDDEDGDDFLVDFPTNRKELLELRQKETGGPEAPVVSDDSPLNNSGRPKVDADEVDQRKPWRRRGQAESIISHTVPSSATSTATRTAIMNAILVEVGPERDDSFRKQKEELAKEYEEIGFAFENEEVAMNDESQLTEANQRDGDGDDDASILSELLFAQAALGWTESKSENSSSIHSSPPDNSATLGTNLRGTPRAGTSLQPTAEEGGSITNDDESMKPYTHSAHGSVNSEIENKKRGSFVGHTIETTHNPPPSPPAARLDSDSPNGPKTPNHNHLTDAPLLLDLKARVQQKLAAARLVFNSHLPSHQKDSLDVSASSSRDGSRHDHQKKPPIPSTCSPIPPKHPMSVAPDPLAASSLHHHQKSPSPMHQSSHKRSRSHGNLPSMQSTPATKDDDRSVSSAGAESSSKPEEARRKKNSDRDAIPPLVPRKRPPQQRSSSFAARAGENDPSGGGPASSSSSSPHRRSRSLSAAPPLPPLKITQPDAAGRRASEQRASETSAAAMAIAMGTAMLDASRRSERPSSSDEEREEMSEEEEGEGASALGGAKAEADDVKNDHRRKRRSRRHRRRRHRRRGDASGGEALRRSESRRRSESGHRSKDRRHDDGEGGEGDKNDDDERHRSRSRRKHHRSRSDRGEGRHRKKPHSKRGLGEEKVDNDDPNEAKAVAIIKSMFTIPGDDIVRSQEESKEEEGISPAFQDHGNADVIAMNCDSSKSSKSQKVTKESMAPSGLTEATKTTTTPTGKLPPDHVIPLHVEDSKQDMDEKSREKRPASTGNGSGSRHSRRNVSESLSLGSFASLSSRDTTSLESLNPSALERPQESKADSTQESGSSSAAFRTGLANFAKVFATSARKENNFKNVWSDDESAYNSDAGGELGIPERLKANLKVTMRTTSWGLKMQRICGPRLWAMKWYIVGAILLLILILAIAIPLSSKGDRGNALPPGAPTPAPNASTSGRPTAYGGYLGFADILGSEAGDAAGSSLSMSSSGIFLAVGYPQTSVGPGAVRIFERDGDEYLPYGDIISGIEEGDKFGFSISLSDDGQTLAIAAPTGDSNAGYVVVFRFDTVSSEWMKLGNTITSAVPEGQAGSAVSISGDGLRVAVGVPRANEFDGVTLVFNYDSLTKLWVRVGQQIVGSDGELNGFSLALDETGETLAIGAVRSPGPENRRGRVYVLRLVNGQWSQFGNAIVGGDNFGRSVSLSDTGRILAVGATGYDNGGDKDVGSCEVFLSSGGRWEQLGETLSGSAVDERSGFSVAISRDGNRLACGGPGASVIRVYELEGAASWVERNLLEGLVATDFGAAVAISGDGSFVAVGAPDESVAGQSNIGVVRAYRD